MTSPVSQTLSEQLRRAIGTHTIVVWLDKDGHYTDFVDAIGEDGPSKVGAPILAYRGSYLDLMRQLAAMSDGVDPSPLVVHVPGANQDSIRRTPLLELNWSGYQFRKGLDTLIRDAAAGRVTPDEVDEFLALDGASLAGADAWMAQRVAEADDTTAMLLRGTDPGRLIQDLVEKAAIEQAIDGEQLAAVWHYFATRTGLPAAWPSAERRARAEDEARQDKRQLADLAAAWVLCVEYVHDLERRAPIAAILQPASALARPLIDACRAAAEHLRSAATSYYKGLADDVEEQIKVEREQGKPGELGRIDTFRFEEDRLLIAALGAVQSHDWAQASGWAAPRLAGKSVWLELDGGRRKAWELIEKAAELGAAIDASTLRFADARNIDEAARRYAKHGAAIDGLHRNFEQQAERDLLFDQLPHVERVRAAVEATRARWHAWAEQAAREWSTLCEDEGALPESSMQQRTVFEEVVEPLLDDNERTVLFLVDAMRYEMAEQLVEQLGSPAASSIRLSPRLAELPSVTEVGMNALAPSAQRGRLHALLDGKRRRFEGFDANGFQVKTRPHRETLLGKRSGGCKWFSIEELQAAPDSSIRRSIARSRLVVVHSVQIDKAGEAGTGLVAFPPELRRIHSAWERLRAVGVRQFVFTADHGFLLRQANAGESITHGKGYDALPRYALYRDVVSNDQQLGLSLRSLGYEGASEAVLVPRGLAVYQSGRDRNFVHGGNSPQERVIPVLTIRHKQALGGEDQHYCVKIESGHGGPTSHELRARVVRADNQTTLALDVDPIELELRAVDGAGVVAEVFECEGATLQSGLISARIGDWFTVAFRLSSAQEQRVRVELFSASAKRRVDAATSRERFAALAPAISVAEPPTPAPEPEPAAAANWLEELEDSGVRRVMAHIAQHGLVSEADLLRLLDNNPRRARKFAREFEDLRARAPFLMELAHGPAGKVYRKITDK